MNLYRVVLNGFDEDDDNNQVVYVVSYNKESAYHKILTDNKHKLEPVERKLKAITLIAKSIRNNKKDVILYL
jgi:hypothetical protein